MVFNDSRVRKARIYGKALDSGAIQELLLLEERTPGLWRVMAKRAKRQRPGRKFSFPGGNIGTVEAEDGEFRLVRFEPAIDEAWLEQNGHIPLPPYIRRADQNMDADRYQTIYARNTGSSAAPTAGLHFTPELLARLDAKGIERHYVTLHVGLGLFCRANREHRNIQCMRSHIR
jgi:S-adenosylmethionine:tRNA ribosyltransferase-isomerase